MLEEHSEILKAWLLLITSQSWDGHLISLSLSAVGGNPFIHPPLLCMHLSIHPTKYLLSVQFSRFWAHKDEQDMASPLKEFTSYQTAV